MLCVARTLRVSRIGAFALAVGSCASSFAGSAQTRPSPASTTDLPTVTVTAPYTREWGGYVISGNFKVNPKLPTVVFPAKPLRRHDILVVQPIHLGDDDYLVLQECASENCHQANLVRVWTAGGSPMPHRHGASKIWIKHENKYWLWIKRLPDIPRKPCDQCGIYFQRFKLISPPMTLIPRGRTAAYYASQIKDAKNNSAIPVKSTRHEGSTFVVIYADGSTVRIKRERAAKYVEDARRKQQ